MTRWAKRTKSVRSLFGVPHRGAIARTINHNILNLLIKICGTVRAVRASYAHLGRPNDAPTTKCSIKGTSDMKNLLTLLTALAATTLAGPALMAAEVSGNVTLASDYSFRGWSQTGLDPAIQGGFDVALEGGFSVGTWASNVNFGASDAGDVASMEWDLYIGWSGEISDGIELGLQLIHFQYPGDTELNYQEVALSLSIGDFGLGVNYSPEYLAAPNETFFYPYASYSHSLTDEISLDFAVGLNIAKSDDFFGDSGEYIDYSATASLPLGGLNFGIGIVGTNLDDAAGCGSDCEARVVVSLSKDL